MNFVRIFDWHVLLVTAFACAATYLCIDHEIAADLPTSLIAVAIVFPIVFSINAAYTRREEALRYLGLVRATIASVTPSIVISTSGFTARFLYHWG